MAQTCSYCAADAEETCSACGKPICPSHTERALPFVSLKELVSTIFSTLFRAPSTLMALLTESPEEEPFCPECRQINSTRRVQEQRKFLYVLLALMAVCALIIYFIVR
jgi:hypothetical protein